MPISGHDLQLALMSGRGDTIVNALRDFGQPTVESLPNDANATLTNTSAEYQITAAPLTAPRTITLPTDNVEGQRFHVVRTAASTGASALSVGGLRDLATGQWAIVVNDGNGWILVAASALV